MKVNILYMGSWHIYWRFSTALYGTVRFTFGGFSTAYSSWYLVLFLVPPRPRFQANRTVTKTWRVKSADYWLAVKNRHCLHHWTCGTRLKSAKDRTQLFWMSAPFLNNQKMAVSLSVEEVQTVLSLIPEERIQRELNGATRNEKSFSGVEAAQL